MQVYKMAWYRSTTFANSELGKHNLMNLET